MGNSACVYLANLYLAAYEFEHAIYCKNRGDRGRLEFLKRKNCKRNLDNIAIFDRKDFKSTFILSDENPFGIYPAYLRYTMEGKEDVSDLTNCDERNTRAIAKAAKSKGWFHTHEVALRHRVKRDRRGKPLYVRIATRVFHKSDDPEYEGLQF